ncbi:MAG: hypothetical protein FWG24_02420 [Eggerthellaceae bacterium]|nr:hypothetical protein [Eggerthellaceae bacterium]
MDVRARTIGLIGYVAAFFVICLLPFVGMLWAKEQPLSSTTEAAVLPELTHDDGSLNLEYLSQASSYFEENFAYRNFAIDANARLKVSLFATSPTDQVIVGTNGWLYYAEELDDYRGLSAMTPRKAKNIAHNLSLMQGYSRARGSEFVFVVAPNKSSLYPGYMPYYYLGQQNENRQLLQACLEEKGVSYLDLFGLFVAEDEELYCLTDSHWNNVGALKVANALLDACDKAEAVVESSFTDDAFVGDIERMLYPKTARPEPLLVFSTGDWHGDNDASSVEDAFIKTVADSGAARADAGTAAGTTTSGDTLLMFRDSFGNSLIPLMAPEFETAYFSKYVPYDFTQIETLKPTHTIVERAERHVGLLAEAPAVLLAPSLTISPVRTLESNTSIEVFEDGNLVVIQGWVDESCIGEDDEIFIEIRSAQSSVGYVPFRISNETADKKAKTGTITYCDYGFKAYFLPDALGKGEHSITVLVSQLETGEVVAVASMMLER